MFGFVGIASRQCAVMNGASNHEFLVCGARGARRWAVQTLTPQDCVLNGASDHAWPFFWFVELAGCTTRLCYDRRVQATMRGILIVGFVVLAGGQCDICTAGLCLGHAWQFKVWFAHAWHFDFRVCRARWCAARALAPQDCLYDRRVQATMRGIYFRVCVLAGEQGKHLHHQTVSRTVQATMGGILIVGFVVLTGGQGKHWHRKIVSRTVQATMHGICF